MHTAKATESRTTVDEHFPQADNTKDALTYDQKCKTWCESIKEAILDGEAETTMERVKAALKDGVDSNDIVKRALVDSMSAVGKDFKNGEFYIPDVLMSSRASHAALFALQNTAEGAPLRKDRGTVVVGTVAGDLHDIGKNIAILMLQCEGYEVVDLGIDVVPETFVKAVKEHKPLVLGLSALLTTTVTEMSNVLQALRDAKVKDKVHVYVSGLPVTQEYADEIGADHYCPDARDTVVYVNSLADTAIA